MYISLYQKDVFVYATVCDYQYQNINRKYMNHFFIINMFYSTHNHI